LEELGKLIACDIVLVEIDVHEAKPDTVPLAERIRVKEALRRTQKMREKADVVSEKWKLQRREKGKIQEKICEIGRPFVVLSREREARKCRKLQKSAVPLPKRKRKSKIREKGPKLEVAIDSKSGEESQQCVDKGECGGRFETIQEPRQQLWAR
jgi:hypothetical protein